MQGIVLKSGFPRRNQILPYLKGSQAIPKISQRAQGIERDDVRGALLAVAHRLADLVGEVLVEPGPQLLAQQLRRGRVWREVVAHHRAAHDGSFEPDRRTSR